MKHSATSRALTVARFRDPLSPRKSNDIRRPKKAAGGQVDDADDWIVPSSVADDWVVPNETKPAPNTLRDVAMQVPTGFNEGLADVAGAPVDAMTWALNKIPGVNIQHPFAGSESIKHGLGYIGADPDKALPQTYGGKLARAGGEGAASMLVPEASLAGLARAGAIAPRALEAAQGMFGSAKSLPEVATNAAVGAGSQGAGKEAEDWAPEPYKPLANMAGNLVGGGLTAAGAVGGREALAAAADAATKYVRPFTESGREALAADTLGNRAISRQALLDNLDNPPPEFVPGSAPTTFQATGDMGLGSLEREVANKNPAEFMQRRAEQNTARLDALRGLEENGSPTDVANAVREQFRNIDQMTSDAVDRATAEATNHTEALGGQGTTEAYGATLRDYAAQARAAAKDQERTLWRAVDPDNTLAIPATPLKQAAASIETSVSPSAKPIAGEERAVLDTIGQYRGVMPFSEVTDLRSRVSTAMREELRASGETPLYARLSRLRGAIENTIAGAVEYRAAQDSHAVARGEMNPEATIAAAIRRQIDEWRSGKVEATGTSNPAGAPSAFAGGTSSIFGGGRAEGSGGWRSANAAGNQGISRDVPLEPNFDEAARERLNTATAATRQRVQTYDKGPVGTVLRPGPMKGQYRSLDSAVPAQIFKRGPTGLEAVNAYRRAVGDQAAMEALGDYAAASLRQAAMRPDGTLDPVRFNAWRKSHADALRAIPDRAASFEDAATASREIENVAAIRRDALDQYQRGSLGSIMGAHDAEDVTRTVGKILAQKDAAKGMRQLAAETRNNPAARQGLRRAVVDAIANRFISNTEAATTGQGLIRSDQFQTFIRNNQAALAQVFSEKEINSLRAIAQDLQRSNRSTVAVKLPGGSNTAQDTADLRTSLMSQLVRHGNHLALGAGTGAPVAFFAGAPLGFIGAVVGAAGATVASALREAGIRKSDDLIREAMLDPELARHLLMKYQPNSKIQGLGLANYLRRNTAATLFNSIQGKNQ